MKNNSIKKFFLLPVLGALLFSCSEQELIVDNGDTTPSPSSFLSVSIVASNTMGTRADADGTYKDGTTAESKVKSVLFLFFDESGNPAKAIKDGSDYLTYLLWDNEEEIKNEGKDSGYTIEQILSKKIINITVPYGTKKPAQLVAVLNPKDNWKDWTTKSAGDLENVIEDFETGLTTDGKFVMTNSVYVEGINNDAKIINTTKLEESKYKTNADDAVADPVVVYVERVAARIDLAIDIKGKDSDNRENPIRIGTGTDAYYIYYTGESIPEDKQDKDKDNGVYVRFLGWNVFSTPNMSRLIKKVNRTWESKDLFGEKDGFITPWNSVDYKRSFWAINPPADTENFKYKFGKFTNGKDVADGDFKNGTWTADYYKIATPDDEGNPRYTTAYFQENAAPYEVTPKSEDIDEVYDGNYISGAPVKPSKVIIAAQLVNSSGEPCDIAKWAGTKYSIDGLKTQFANMLKLWKVSDVEGEDDPTEETRTTYKRVTKNDITFEKSENTGSVYNVKVVPVDKNAVWYTKAEDKDEFTEVADIQEEINKVVGDKTVSVWTDGYTYFYFDIRHLGTVKSPGYYGVVRNHIYDTKVTSVSGLGTPIFDKDESIDEVTPPTEESGVLAAEVRILQWRVVSQSYDLTW